MSNANRDYSIVYDVKNSLLVLSRPLNFYLTDKNTSNIFVKLVTKVIVGDGIDQYTDIQNASGYVLTMRVIKPDDEVKSLRATQHELESIFQFDLTEDFKDIPGKYICELTISNIVNGRQEFTTSDPFSYEVKRSILSNVKNIIEGKETTVEKLLNELDAAKAEFSSQIKDVAQDTYITKNKINEITKTMNEISTTGTTKELVQECTNAKINEFLASGLLSNMTIGNKSIGSEKMKFNFAKVVQNECIVIDFKTKKIKFNRENGMHYVIDTVLNEIKNTEDIDFKNKGFDGTGLLYIDDNGMVNIGSLYYGVNIPENSTILAYVYDTENIKEVITFNKSAFKVIKEEETKKYDILNAGILENNSIEVNLLTNKISIKDCHVVTTDGLVNISNDIIDFLLPEIGGTICLYLENNTIKKATLYPYTVPAGDIQILGYIFYNGTDVSIISFNNSAFTVIDETYYKLGQLGDSLTFNADLARKEMMKILNLREDINVNAIIGSTVANMSNPEVTPFISRYQDTPADCDIITIMGGTNDCAGNIPIGEIGTKDEFTFMGALQIIIEYYYLRKNDVRIILITPTPFWFYGGDRPFASNIINYVNAIKSLGEYYNIPVLDLYHTLGINEFSKNELTTDLIHYKDATNRRFGRMLGNFIKNNI